MQSSAGVAYIASSCHHLYAIVADRCVIFVLRIHYLSWLPVLFYQRFNPVERIPSNSVQLYKVGLKVIKQLAIFGLLRSILSHYHGLTSRYGNKHTRMIQHKFLIEF